MSWRIFSILLFVFFLSANSQAQGIERKFEVNVVNLNSSQPVTNAFIQVYFQDQLMISGYTDTSGRLISNLILPDSSNQYIKVICTLPEGLKCVGTCKKTMAVFPKTQNIEVDFYVDSGSQSDRSNVYLYIDSNGNPDQEKNKTAYNFIVEMVVKEQKTVCLFYAGKVPANYEKKLKQMKKELIKQGVPPGKIKIIAPSGDSQKETPIKFTFCE